MTIPAMKIATNLISGPYSFIIFWKPEASSWRIIAVSGSYHGGLGSSFGASNKHPFIR
jgi:hypothetical protein